MSCIQVQVWEVFLESFSSYPWRHIGVDRCPGTAFTDADLIGLGWALGSNFLFFLNPEGILICSKIEDCSCVSYVSQCSLPL